MQSDRPPQQTHATLQHHVPFGNASAAIISSPSSLVPKCLRGWLTLLPALRSWLLTPPLCSPIQLRRFSDPHLTFSSEALRPVLGSAAPRGCPAQPPPEDCAGVTVPWSARRALVDPHCLSWLLGFLPHLPSPDCLVISTASDGPRGQAMICRNELRPRLMLCSTEGAVPFLPARHLGPGSVGSPKIQAQVSPDVGRLDAHCAAHQSPGHPHSRCHLPGHGYPSRPHALQASDAAKAKFNSSATSSRTANTPGQNWQGPSVPADSGLVWIAAWATVVCPVSS